jgi:predicted nucleic acid-binding protein
MMDFLGERVPFHEDASKLMSLADKSEVTLVVSALSFATVSYLLSKYEGIKVTKEKLRKFKILSQVVDLDENIIEKSLNSNFKDFEDGLQYFSALNAECKIIITRNPKDFKTSQLPTMSTKEFLESIR